MEIKSNFSLKNYNSFGIESLAKQFIAVHTLNEIKIYTWRRKQYVINPGHRCSSNTY
jgi:UDP-N-acetylenolpyruvoylglucosamine reductase